MKFGFYLPTRGEGAEPDALAALVARAEALGFHSVVIADHIVFPAAFDSKYPYTVAGDFPGRGDTLEQLTLMSFVAAKSRTLRLISSIMVLPHRNPVVTAKMLATIDVLSKGRVTVGVGVGWLKEEFEALGVPHFHARGRLSDEYLEIFKKLWTEDPAEHSGEFYSFDPLRCLPRPVQSPHPPIWIGGHSRAALRRVVRHGDGWHPVGATPAVSLGPTEFAAALDTLKTLMAGQGRDFGDLSISFKAPLYDMDKRGSGGERLPFSGSKDAVAEDIRVYEALGVSELIFDFRVGSPAESIERMAQFAEEIMP